MAALPNCHILWPGDEDVAEAMAKVDAKHKALETSKKQAEKRREVAHRTHKDSVEIANKAEASLKQLEEHLAQVKAKAEAARAEERANFDALCLAKDAELVAKVEFAKFEENISKAGVPADGSS